MGRFPSSAICFDSVRGDHSATIAVMKDSSQPTVATDRAGRLLILVLLTMMAFAANSILCRQALGLVLVEDRIPVPHHEFEQLRRLGLALEGVLVGRFPTSHHVQVFAWHHRVGPRDQRAEQPVEPLERQSIRVLESAQESAEPFEFGVSQRFTAWTHRRHSADGLIRRPLRGRHPGLLR